MKSVMCFLIIVVWPFAFVAQIYVSTDSRTDGNTYNSYVLAMMEKYGSPDKPGPTPYRRSSFSAEGNSGLEPSHEPTSSSDPVEVYS